MAVLLDSLLAWASRGLHVFPLTPGSKKPLKGSHGLEDATTDPNIIRAWYGATPDLNWGLNAGRSGLLIVDVDQKSGKDGKASLAALEAKHGLLPPSFTVLTPSKGLHIYLTGKGASTTGKLGPGLDTRGEGGYVVLPGSWLQVGGEYTILSAAGVGVAPAPQWLLDLVGEPAERMEASQEPAVPLDTPELIADVVAYLQASAPLAVEGQGGDATTLRVAMACRDRGVSEETCRGLMTRFWNDRCSPPWDQDGLVRKVANAYRYAQNQAGIAAPEAAGFKPIELPGMFALRASTFNEADMPARPWVLGHRLIAGFVTATVAHGGVGKSTLTMLESLAVATGENLTGDEPVRTGAVWIYNTEDPMDELKRRVIAAAKRHNLLVSSLSNVHVTSGRSHPLVLAHSGPSGPVIHVEQLHQVIDYIRKHNIIVWNVDPFVHTHYVDENSNVEIAVVMQCFGKIAEETGCAISLVHHTTKGAGGEGEMDRARGASAFGGAVRIMGTVMTMNEEDAPRWGVAPADHKMYFRLDDAKSNMTAPSSEVRWFQKVSEILMPAGDSVGTIIRVDLSPVTSEVDDDVLELVLQHAEKFVGPPHMRDAVYPTLA